MKVGYNTSSTVIIFIGGEDGLVISILTPTDGMDGWMDSLYSIAHDLFAERNG